MPDAKRKGTFDIVRQVTVDDETLRKIAEVLGIPEAEPSPPPPAPSRRRRQRN
jgi:hypothetical protein